MESFVMRSRPGQVSGAYAGTGSVLRAPHDERGGQPEGGAVRTAPGPHRDHVAARAGGEHPATAPARVLDGGKLGAQLGDPGPQRGDLVLELEDLLDPGEADALV